MRRLLIIFVVVAALVVVRIVAVALLPEEIGFWILNQRNVTSCLSTRTTPSPSARSSSRRSARK